MRPHEIPWATFVFLLVVFSLISQFDFPSDHIDDGVTVDQMTERIESGNIGRAVALIGLGLFGVVRLARKKQSRFRVKTFLGVVICLYLILAVSSVIWADDTVFAIKRVTSLILLSFGALALAQRLNFRQLKSLTIFICGFTLAISAICELGLTTFRPFDPSWRFAGVIHPVAQGWNCGILAIAAAAMSARSTLQRVAGYGVVATSLFFLVLTRSRMAFLSLVVALCLYLFMTSRKPYRVGLVLGLSIVTCITALILAGDAQKLAEFGRGSEGEDSIGSLNGRIPVWGELLSYASKRPLVGYGYNGFFSPSHIRSISDEVGWVPIHAHSGYMEALLDLGIVGEILLLLILAASVKRALSLSGQDSGYAFVAAIIVWLCINLLTETLATGDDFPTFLCMVLLAKLAFLSPRMSRTEIWARTRRPMLTVAPS
jgi:exopolysaccharide production protein ExoQ